MLHHNRDSCHATHAESNKGKEMMNQVCINNPPSTELLSVSVWRVVLDISTRVSLSCQTTRALGLDLGSWYFHFSVLLSSQLGGSTLTLASSYFALEFTFILWVLGNQLVSSIDMLLFTAWINVPRTSYAPLYSVAVATVCLMKLHKIRQSSLFFKSQIRIQN